MQRTGNLNNHKRQKKAREEAFKYQKKEIEMVKVKKKSKLPSQNRRINWWQKQKELLAKETEAKLAQIKVEDKQACQTIFKEVETNQLNLEQRARENAQELERKK